MVQSLRARPWESGAWIDITALPPISYITLDKLLNLSETPSVKSD